MKKKNNNWLDQYEEGGNPFTDPPIKASRVDTVPQGYKQLGVSGNKTYYDKEAKQAIPSTGSGTPNAQWENSIRQQLQSGVSPEELVKKGHISQAAIPKYQQYYKPVYTEQAAKPTPTPTTLQSNTPNNKQPEFAFGIPYAGERKDVTHLVGAGTYNYRDESGKEYGVRAYDLPGQYDPKTQKWITKDGYSNATRTYAYVKDDKLVPFDPNFSTVVNDEKAKKVYYSKVGLDPKYISQQEQSKALEHGPLTQMPSGSDYLISQGAKYDPNLDTVSKLNQGHLSTGTFSNINQTVGKENLPSYKEYGGWLDKYEESFRYGGSKRAGLKKYTSKNIKSSINTLFSRNHDLFGPGGKKYYHPLAKYFDGGFNAGNALPGATQSTDWSMMANPNAVDYRAQAYPNATNPTMMQGTAAPTVMDKLTPTMGFDAKQKFDSPFFGGGKLAGLARGVMPWATQLGMQDEYRAMEQNAFAQTNANAVFRKDDQKNLGTHTSDTYGIDTFRPNQVGMKVFGQGLAYENQNITRYGGQADKYEYGGWLDQYDDGGSTTANKAKQAALEEEADRMRGNIAAASSTMVRQPIIPNTTPVKKKEEPKKLNITAPNIPKNRAEAEQVLDKQRKEKFAAEAKEAQKVKMMTSAQKEKYYADKERERYVNDPSLLDYAGQAGYMPLLAISNPFSIGERLKELRQIKSDPNATASDVFSKSIMDVGLPATNEALLNEIVGAGLMKGAATAAPILANAKNAITKTGTNIKNKFYPQSANADVEAAQYFQNYQQAKPQLDQIDYNEWINKKADEALDYFKSDYNKFKLQKSDYNKFKKIEETPLQEKQVFTLGDDPFAVGSSGSFDNSGVFTYGESPVKKVGLLGESKNKLFSKSSKKAKLNEMDDDFFNSQNYKDFNDKVSDKAYKNIANRAYENLGDIVPAKELRQAHKEAIDYFKDYDEITPHQLSLFMREKFADKIANFKIPKFTDAAGNVIDLNRSAPFLQRQLFLESKNPIDKLKKLTGKKAYTPEELAAALKSNREDIKNITSGFEDFTKGFNQTIRKMKNSESLTAKDWNLVDAYSRGYDDIMNRIYRTGQSVKPGSADEYFLKKAKELEGLILKNKVDSKKIPMVRRGLHDYDVELYDPKTLQPLGITKRKGELEVGDTFLDKGFVSTTARTEGIGQFGRPHASEYIKIPEGNSLSFAAPNYNSFSQFGRAGEDELILPPNMFRQISEINPEYAQQGVPKYTSIILNPRKKGGSASNWLDNY
jgi:hypothetical protein